MQTNLVMVIIELAMTVVLLGFGLFFLLSRGKAVKLIGGYSNLSKERRDAVDKVGLCREYGRTLCIWSTFFLPGALLDWFFPGVGLMLSASAFIISMVIHMVRTHKRLGGDMNDLL